MAQRLLPLLTLACCCCVTGSLDLNWIDLGCPQAAKSCAYQNPSSSDDMAVTLFFQVEDTQGAASFQCTSGTIVQCSRSWQVSEQGSAGTCFFFLKASQKFQCTGKGTVNMIGAHATKLDGKLLGADVKQIPCTGALKTCSYKNSEAQDQWVTMSYSTSSAKDAISCLSDAYEVCSYKGMGADGASSCTFLLPSGSELSCKATSGSPSITSIAAVPLEKQLAPVGEKIASTCPPETGSNVTFCDCEYKNPSNKDLIVVMNAMNADGKFNSFHCGVGEANTCAWGANNGESGVAGSCSFILPAGATYTCAMQYGATAFPSVTVLPLTGSSIFPASQPATHSQKAPGVSFVPATRSDSDLRRLFAEFQSQHGTVDQARFQHFVKFVALSDNHPTNPLLLNGSELSPMAVLSQAEFEASYRDCAKPEKGFVSRSTATDLDLHTPPAAIDWRSKGAVTPVKDQGQCGSCWSFSTTGVIEGAWAVAGHGLTSLSEQHLVSCDNKDGNVGCGGGWPYKAIDYVHQNNGIDTEASYPYTSGTGKAPACAASRGTKASVHVLKHTAVEANEVTMAAWVAQNGPLSVSVDAMTQLWFPYRAGIISTCCNKEVDHAVLVVGFGESDGQKYWVIKNSWNANWGEKGYLRLERGSDQCGITYAPVGAVVGAPGPTPTPPTPTPPAPPTPPTPPTPPSPSTACPSDAEEVSTAKGNECRWVNGTKGVEMPSNPIEYCEYIGRGYIGYSWDQSQGDVDCPASARKAGNYCLWDDGQKGVKMPTGSIADCKNVAKGQIGFIVPTSTEIVV